MTSPGNTCLAVPNHDHMNAPNEINAAALKTGATEKVTPMMHGCLSPAK